MNFDKRTHTYTDDNGNIIPSVTSVISECLYLEVKRFFTLESRQRGEAVHKACELYDLERLDFDSLHDNIKGYVNAYKRFKSEIKPKWSGIEDSFISPLGYAGTYDRYGYIQDKPVLADIKTGTVGMVDLQLAAYKFGCEEEDAKEADRAVIELKPDGFYKFYRLLKSTEGRDFKVFMSCLNVYNYKKERGIIE